MDEEYTIELYETEKGKCPYVEWERKLDVKIRAQVMRRIARIRLGNFGDCKPIENGVWELRIDKGPGYRIYYGKKRKKIVILLSAGEKRSQSRDIKKALKYWESI
jgi:putative addiction module killer protein